MSITAIVTPLKWCVLMPMLLLALFVAAALAGFAKLLDDIA